MESAPPLAALLAAQPLDMGNHWPKLPASVGELLQEYHTPVTTQMRLYSTFTTQLHVKNLVLYTCMRCENPCIPRHAGTCSAVRRWAYSSNLQQLHLQAACLVYNTYIPLHTLTENRENNRSTFRLPRG
jgi:hypothetical protein